MFNRDFLPHVAKAYGVNAVFGWDDDKELTEEEEKMDNLAFLVLRQYLTDRVLKIITVGNPTRASAVFKALTTIYLTNDVRSSVQIGRELASCEMALGEALPDFLARINDLMEESQQMGDPITDKQRVVMLATRLRDPWRTLANDRIDRDDHLTYLGLVQHLVQR